MNIFILNTGRSGSVTFIKACNHITNFTSAHESRSHIIGDNHFNYPENHIEADNRLAWFLGKLDKKYGDNAIYVHLQRNQDDTVKSFTKRYENEKGIVWAYRHNIIMNNESQEDPFNVCQDYWSTVTQNISFFLKDKTKKMDYHLENAKEDFKVFWELIEAEGDFENALGEWDRKYNLSSNNKLSLKRKLLRSLRNYLPVL